MDSADSAHSAREASDVPTPAGPRDPLDAFTDAAAVVSLDGIVVGWTRGAEALLGHPAAAVVGRPAAELVAGPADPDRAAGVAERCRAGTGWSGLIAVRHRDGTAVDVGLRVSASFRIGADECFLISARRQSRHRTVDQSVPDGFLTRSPLGMAVMDLQLRYRTLAQGSTLRGGGAGHPEPSGPEGRSCTAEVALSDNVVGGPTAGLAGRQACGDLVRPPSGDRGR